MMHGQKQSDSLLLSSNPVCRMVGKRVKVRIRNSTPFFVELCQMSIWNLKDWQTRVKQCRKGL